MDPAGSWARWRHSDVVDVSGADLVVRNYLEQRDVRKYLELASSRMSMQVACDFGCGFARMTMVLGEFCSRVIGIEREPDLIEDVRRLQPRVRAVQVLSLGQLPLETGSCDFVLSFTVLQHLVDAEAERAIAELSGSSGAEAMPCSARRPMPAWLRALFTILPESARSAAPSRPIKSSSSRSFWSSPRQGGSSPVIRGRMSGGTCSSRRDDSRREHGMTV